MVKSDKWIIEQKGMIEPFVNKQVSRGGIISYGLSSGGYDIRIADEFQLFTNLGSGIADAKSFDSSNVVEGKAKVILMPPGSFMLAKSVETIKVPRDIMVIAKDKSTYARVGATLLGGVLDPGWGGQITLEIANLSGLPLPIYANEGICQLLFLEMDQECDVSYADKKGKYQWQKGITQAKVID